MQITTIGLDLAKNLLQVHAVDSDGQVVLRRRLARAEVVPFFANLAPCRIGVEACGTAHYWARELIALGHEVRLMPAAYVKPYVKRGKNDAADAEAICEAVTRPTMRFVPVKSAEQQAVLMVHRTWDLLVRQRTMLVNALRGHLAELGIVAAQGIARVTQLAAIVFDEADGRLPAFARQALQALVAQIRDVQARIATLEAELVAWCRRDDASRRLATIPGVGPITATAMAATVTDPSCFSSGRQLAAWLAGAAAELERWQATSGRHFQTGRPIPPAPAGRRRPHHHPLRAQQGTGRSALDHGPPRPASSPRCRRRARQQDGTDRLGDSRPWRRLPSRSRRGEQLNAGRSKSSV